MKPWKIAGIALLGLLASCNSDLEVIEKGGIGSNKSYTSDLNAFQNNNGDNAPGVVRIHLDTSTPNSQVAQPKPRTYYVLSNHISKFALDFSNDQTIRTPQTMIEDTVNFAEDAMFSKSPYGTHGSLYSGKIVEPDKTFLYEVYKDNQSGVTLMTEYHKGDLSYLQIGGLALEKSLPDGDQIYTGVNFMTNTGDLPNNEGRHLHPGTFEMNVNFQKGNGRINATSELGYNINDSEFEIDTKDGTFKSGSINLMHNNLSVSKTGTLKGNFHGNSAIGVSGIYYNSVNQELPSLIGLIVGSRSDGN